jgi:EAL domain-containing protein (putative c-di-GMP-specific phosphodiesterase class I)
MNVHPAELGTDRLEEALRRIREAHPEMKLTVEVPEPAIGDLKELKSLRSLLSELNMELAYDDFAADRKRLQELAKVPGQTIKFDIPLLSGDGPFTKADSQKIGELVQVAKDAGLIPLAEGVETAAEHRLCAELGFKWAQGFFYGRPALFG